MKVTALVIHTLSSVSYKNDGHTQTFERAAMLTYYFNYMTYGLNLQV